MRIIDRFLLNDKCNIKIDEDVYIEKYGLDLISNSGYSIKLSSSKLAKIGDIVEIDNNIYSLSKIIGDEIYIKSILNLMNVDFYFTGGTLKELLQAAFTNNPIANANLSVLEFNSIKEINVKSDIINIKTYIENLLLSEKLQIKSYLKNSRVYIDIIDANIIPINVELFDFLEIPELDQIINHYKVIKRQVDVDGNLLVEVIEDYFLNKDGSINQTSSNYERIRTFSKIVTYRDEVPDYMEDVYNKLSDTSIYTSTFIIHDETLSLMNDEINVGTIIKIFGDDLETLNVQVTSIEKTQFHTTCKVGTNRLDILKNIERE